MATPKANLTGYFPYGLAADRPAAPTPTAGCFMFYYAQDTGVLSLWDPNAAAWVDLPFTFDTLMDAVISGVADRDVLVYDAGSGGGWRNQRQKYVIAAGVSGVLTNSQDLLLHRFAVGVTFPANFSSYLGLSSQAGGTANATGSTVINVDKALTGSPNSFSNVGSITIGAGGVTPTLATVGGAAVTFAAGDVLRLRGPASADATFAGFYGTLVGYET